MSRSKVDWARIVDCAKKNPGVCNKHLSDRFGVSADSIRKYFAAHNIRPAEGPDPICQNCHKAVLIPTGQKITAESARAYCPHCKRHFASTCQSIVRGSVYPPGQQAKAKINSRKFTVMR